MSYYRGEHRLRNRRRKLAHAPTPNQYRVKRSGGRGRSLKERGTGRDTYDGSGPIERIERHARLAGSKGSSAVHRARRDAEKAARA